MKQIKKDAQKEETVLDALAEAVVYAKENKIHTFVFVGLSNDGNDVKTIFLGTKHYEFQTIGCLEIVKRDVLNQIPELKKGEI